MSEVISPVQCPTCKIGKVSLYRKQLKEGRTCYAATCLNCKTLVTGKERTAIFFPDGFNKRFNDLPLMDGFSQPIDTQQQNNFPQAIKKAKTFQNYGNLRALFRRFSELPDHVLDELTKPQLETPQNSYDVQAKNYEIPNPDEV